MGLYGKYVLPKLTDLSCGTRPVMRQREKIVPRARGRVLEVGIGSGLNLRFYDKSRVEEILGLEPSPELAALAQREAAFHETAFTWLEAGIEDVPLPEHSVDTVVITYTLCTVPDPERGLREMRRVLRPGGDLLFCEHGAAPDPHVLLWQRRLTPLWRRFSGGCHLDRPIADLLTGNGFELGQVETMYLPGTLRVVGFNTWGEARPRPE